MNTPALPAIRGGAPVRPAMLAYGRQTIEAEDIEAVAAALRSDWLTTGPRVGAFERAFAEFTGTREAVAVSNGTAALHVAMAALGLGPGDEVIVPALTFAASANAAVYQGATPVFADVDDSTLLLDPADVRRRLSPRTRAIIAVDYAGQPCDYPALSALAEEHGVALVADACHALGGSLDGQPVGSLADLSTFSFHPVKGMTTGEGGMVTTDRADLAGRMRVFRNHGITTDHRQREASGTSTYEMTGLGFNYRLTDFQCALGLSQLARVPAWRRRREEIARIYDAAFAGMCGVAPLSHRPGTSHGWHLYVVRVAPELMDRQTMFAALRAENIGVVVHYPPVHLHPFYRKRLGTGPGLCPRAEEAAAQVLSLPLFPTMSDADAEDVIAAVGKVAWHCARAVPA